MNEPETQECAGLQLVKLPPTLALLPTRDLVLFPYMVAPLIISRSVSAAAVQRALLTPERMLLVCLQRHAGEDLPGPSGLHHTGTLATVLRVTPLSDGRTKVVVQGLQRVRAEEWLEQSPCHVIRPVALPGEPGLAQPLPGSLPGPGTGGASDRAELRSRLLGEPLELLGEAPLHHVELQALQRQIKEDLDRYARSDKVRTPELTELLHGFDESVPERFADMVAANLHIPPEEAQRILEAPEVAVRLRLLAGFLRRELQLLDLQEGIRARTKEVLTRAQREHFLREQLRQIHTELDGGSDELGELRQQIRACGMSGEALTEAERQLCRLEAMPAQSAEGQVVRAHLTWLVELPWLAVTEDRFDLGLARRALDEEHADLAAVKQRILEFLSVMQLRRAATAVKGGRGAGGSILCFAGPPGVGKTTLGRSIARALGRRFVRVQLGGVRDDAEVRGHRRTYVGALPGRLIQGLRQAGTRNPVMLLDEIDKLCADSHGDPAAALLEVLDPEQNSGFRDHYLGVPFDLSEVLFIATANSLERIPPALRDRLEILQLSGYTDEEKLTIATRHLVPRAIVSAGLSPTYKVRITAPALRALISQYTHEAGLRDLDRQLAALCRKLAHQVVAQESALPTPGLSRPTAPVPTHLHLADKSHLDRELAGLFLVPILPPSCKLLTVTRQSLGRLLGPPPITRLTLDPAASALKPAIGLCVGLAWTPAGGEVLTIETQRMPGLGGLRLTGQLGEVMRESAQTALSYARAVATNLGCPDPFVQNHEVHVHVPAGAIPKDGPSAGVTIACALVSLLTARPVRPGVAMTGEVTLRGRVLAVGGLKEKLLAARRAGLRTVLIPRDNQADLLALPRSLTRALQLILVSDMEELLREALVYEATPQHTRTHSPDCPERSSEKPRHGAGRKRTA